MVDMLLAAILAVELPGSYGCVVERQVVIDETAEDRPREVRFEGTSREPWRFGVRVSDGARTTVIIDWPENPVNVAGRFQATPLAPGQVAFAVGSRGPCMFTEQSCVTIFELSARDDGSAAFSILPAGSLRHGTGPRTLFHVVLLGTCRRQGGAE